MKKKKRKLQIGGNEGGDERQRESDGKERRSKRNDVAADREGSQAISTEDIANVQR